MAQHTLFKHFAKKDPKNEMVIEEKNPEKTLPQDLIPWVEKYRPNKLDEISFQEEVVNILNGILLTGELPHTILYGPPGTGKTSSVLALAKQLYGPEYRNRIVELNASDDRGINVVRDKIKKFAQTIVAKKTDKKYLCPNYKIIILDEADSLTDDAQNALRRIIEDTSANTRFCIICNYITKIIDPLSSRCVKLRFKPISEEAQFLKLKHVCENEGILFEEEALKTLILLSNGDLRKSINMLQAGSTLYEKKIDQMAVIDISGSVPPTIIDHIINKIKEGNLDSLLRAIDDILLEGYPSDQILSQFFDSLINMKEIHEIKKSRIFEKIAWCDQCLLEGGREDLQLRNLFAACLDIFREKI